SQLPRDGELILVDPQAAVTAEALLTLATAERGSRGLVDYRRLVARLDARWLQNRTLTCVENVVPRDAELLDLPVVPYRGKFDEPRAEKLLLRGAAKKPPTGASGGAVQRELALPVAKRLARANIHPTTVRWLGLLTLLASFVTLARGSLLLGAALYA